KSVKSLFEFIPLPHPVKFSSEDSGLVFNVTEIKEKRGKVRGIENIEQPMIGREEELNQLKECFSHSMYDGKFLITLITGEAGIGKTRLFTEFEKSFTRFKTLSVLKGRCLPYGKSFSYWPVMEILKQVLDIKERSTKEEIILKITTFSEKIFKDLALPYLDYKGILLNFLGLKSVKT
ncbi:MAG: AAA family ATPase, partial [bacterium]|nr:AAA family ATPase [bacterium]